jgi:outer membrane protein TolC
MTNRGKRILAVAALGMLMGGCAVKTVPLTESEVTAQIADDMKRIYQDQVPLKGPVTLDEAISRTLANNLDYRLKLMEEALSLQQLDVVSYEMLPRLAANAGYTERDKYNASSSTSILTGQQSLESSYSQDKRDSTVNLALTWNILDFGVSYFQAKQQADRALIMNERRRKVTHVLVQQVRHAYWLALGAQQLEGRLEPLLLDVRKALEDTTAMEREKLRPPLETLNYRKTLLETMRQVEAFRDELNQAKPKLATLMNLPPGQKFELAANSSMDMPVLSETLEVMETLALKMRPELMEARLQERINLYETKKAIARMLPGIDLNVGKYMDTNSFLYNPNWIEGGARLTWNLMSLITGPAQYKVAKSQVEVSRMSRLALSMAVLTQVHVAYMDFFSKSRQYELADQIQQLDARIYRIAKNETITGAQNRLNEIRTGVGSIMTEYRRYQNYASLQNAYGQLQVSIGVPPETGKPLVPAVAAQPAATAPAAAAETTPSAAAAAPAVPAPAADPVVPAPAEEQPKPASVKP